MKITDSLSITELSRLTGKTRPTLYKYVSDYERENYDNIPYSFKLLFDMIVVDKKDIAEIKSYCSKKFVDKHEDKASELVDLIMKNKNKLDLDKLIKRVKEDL